MEMEGEVVARRLMARPKLGESGSVGAARLVPRVSWWSGVGSGVGGRRVTGMVSLMRVGPETFPLKWSLEAVGVRGWLVVVGSSFSAMPGCVVTASASTRFMKEGCCAKCQRDVYKTGVDKYNDLPRWSLRF